MHDLLIGFGLVAIALISMIVATVFGFAVVRAYVVWRHGTRAGLSEPSTRP